MREQESVEGCLTKKHKETLGEADMFIILIVVMTSPVPKLTKYEYPKIHQYLLKINLIKEILSNRKTGKSEEYTKIYLTY